MSANDNLKLVHLRSGNVESQLSNEASVFVTSPPPTGSGMKIEGAAKVEIISEYHFAGDFDSRSLEGVSKEGTVPMNFQTGDVEPDWSSDDGLMTAVLGEPPTATGLELSLKDQVFLAANEETSRSIFPV